MSLTTLIAVSVLPEKKIPTAVAMADPSYGVLGSVVKVDGRLSSDPDGNTLTYTWTFDSVPIGSQVIGEGFRQLDADGAMVSFSPDIVGEYVIGLTVNNGMFDSVKSQTVSSIRAILVPHGQGLVPDGKWIWSYIRDVWQQATDKELFETLWSALIQIVGAELIKLYQIDFNKSIKDIQDLYQRRWLSYEPSREVLINGPNFYIGNHYAGTTASTVNLGLEGLLIILSNNEVVLIEGSLLQSVVGETLTISGSQDSANDGSYQVAGINLGNNGYKLAASTTIPDPSSDLIASGVELTFDFQSTGWTLLGSHGTPYAELLSEWANPMDTLLPLFWAPSAGILGAQVGDVIHYKAGPNKGFYRITSKSGTFITVDKAPPSYSDATLATTYTADIYRPAHFTLSQPDQVLTNTVAIPWDSTKDVSKIAPGRILIVNGQAFTIVSTYLDTGQIEPTVIVTVDKTTLQSGLSNLNWRTPPTLISTTQDFEAEGFSSGDKITFSLVKDGNIPIDLEFQVLGVDGGALGFVYSLAPTTPGVVDPVPNSLILQLADAFDVTGVVQNPDGSLTYTGQSKTFIDTINSTEFKNKYFNTLLTPETDISINPNFRARAYSATRNFLIPVDDTLKSIPLLQNFVVQPTVTQHDGKTFIVKDGVEYETPFPPYYLKENIDYIIDDEVAFKGSLTFQTGSDIIEADGGDFVDRNIQPGDSFRITNPITLDRTYYIAEVQSATKIRLSKPLPLYALSPIVTADVVIERQRQGRFLRFVPGRFTAEQPAPDRLWAEVSFFDNSPNVEANFGILVGLTKADLDSVSSDLNYRQAVAGLMFAFLNGSTIEHVRLGIQILLGLPFAESRGIVRSIEQDYRLDINGNPIQGRILIEDVDSTGTPQGTLRPYIFPIDSVSALAGLETNPATNKTYQVGDTVEQFAALCKGVEVSDYVSDPLDSNFSVARLLQQYHSLRIRINDNIFTPNEFSLVSSFLKKITPSYVAYFLSTLSEFADDVSILDAIHNRLNFADFSCVDNASLSMPPTLMMNSRNVSGIPQIRIGDGVFWVRRSGNDLQTTDGSNTVTIPSGGILNPRINESFEAPLTVASDNLLIINGINAGLYTSSSVTDTTITLSDGPTLGMEPATGLRYAILRSVPYFLLSGTASLTSGDSTITLGAGLRTYGIAPGDWLLNMSGTDIRSRYTITEVKESVPGSGSYDQVTVTPAPLVTGPTSFAVARNSFIPSPFPDSGGGLNFSSSGANTFTFINQILKSVLEVGDEIQVEGSTGLTRVTVIGPEQGYVTPALPAGSYTGFVYKKKHNQTKIGWDHISLFDPEDPATMTLVEDQALASCNATSNIVSLQQQRTTAPISGPSAVNPVTLQIRPGDMLVLGGTNGTVDIGYGAGIYPIAQVTATDVRLVVALGTTESVSWAIQRRR